MEKKNFNWWIKKEKIIIFFQSVALRQLVIFINKTAYPYGIEIERYKLEETM